MASSWLICQSVWPSPRWRLALSCSAVKCMIGSDFPVIGAIRGNNPRPPVAFRPDHQIEFAVVHLTDSTPAVFIMTGRVVGKCRAAVKQLCRVHEVHLVVTDIHVPLRFIPLELHILYIYKL